MAEPTHFRGKTALEHIIEAQAKGIIASSESHGAETPGYVSAAADAARETAILQLLVWTILTHVGISSLEIILILLCLTISWTAWKLGRGAWLGWTRLERLHRIVEEERWEIEHHRVQEREELKILYEAKGFQGKLLEDVVDVLMADGDRLLKVMIEEEMGLALEVHEHPLKQGLGAALGVLLSAFVCIQMQWLVSSLGMLIGATAMIGFAAGLSAYLERNRIIPAVIWNLAIAGLSFACTYFLLDWWQVTHGQ